MYRVLGRTTQSCLCIVVTIVSHVCDRVYVLLRSCLMYVIVSMYCCYGRVSCMCVYRVDTKSRYLRRHYLSC